MLLEALQQCCGGVVRLRTQLDRVDQLVRDTCQEAGLGFRRGLVELREEEAERARGLNVTLQMLLRGQRTEGGDTRTTPTAPFSFSVKPRPSGPKEQGSPGCHSNRAGEGSPAAEETGEGTS